MISRIERRDSVESSHITQQVLLEKQKSNSCDVVLIRQKHCKLFSGETSRTPERIVVLFTAFE